MAITSILASLLLPVLSRAKCCAMNIQCLNQMRQVGLAVRLYADENEDQFPRSQHSAFANKQPPWERAIAPQLGGADTGGATLTNLERNVYHCPADTKAAPSLSYGINVYFELEDSGGFLSCHRVSQVPHPTTTILFPEVAVATDHIMAEDWTSLSDATSDVASTRHRTKSNFVFGDGHAEGMQLHHTYNPPGLDLWNPSLAR